MSNRKLANNGKMEAVLYARFSPRPIRKKDSAPIKEISNDVQLERLRAYGVAHDWNVIAEIPEEYASGASVEGRPEFQRAMALACEKPRILAVHAFRAFARNTKEAIELAEQLEVAGSHLVSLNEHIDTTNATGRFVFRLIASIAELERERTIERTKEGMQYRQANGERMSRFAPYGKKIVKGKLVDDPDEQRAIERIYELADKGKTTYAICIRLEYERVKPRGDKWHPSTIQRILDKRAAN